MTDRVLLDGENDRWFEVLPGKFSWGFSRWDAERRANATAGSVVVLNTPEEIAKWYKGVTDVTPTPEAPSLENRAHDDLVTLRPDVEDGDFMFGDLTDAWQRGYKVGLKDVRRVGVRPVTWQQLEETREAVRPVVLVGSYGQGYHREVLYDFQTQTYLVYDQRVEVLRTRNAHAAATKYNEFRDDT